MHKIFKVLADSFVVQPAGENFLVQILELERNADAVTYGYAISASLIEHYSKEQIRECSPSKYLGDGKVQRFQASMWLDVMVCIEEGFYTVDSFKRNQILWKILETHPDEFKRFVRKPKKGSKTT